MKRFTSAIFALASVLLLASCSFDPLSWLPNDSSEQSAERMTLIVDALNAQDTAALRGMFTDYAQAEYSAEIEEGLVYLFSLFPDRDVIWENPDDSPSVSTANDFGKRLRVASSTNIVSSGGKTYTLFFSDFTINDREPDNVGVYGLGAAPRTETRNSGPEGAFFSWAASVSSLEENDAPGVYIPDGDTTDFSDRRMRDITSYLNAQNDSGLKQYVFTEYAQSQYSEELAGQIAQLFALFPSDDLVWQPLPEEPTVRERVDGDNETILLLSSYPVTSGGKDYWLSFADFTVNEIAPDNLGLYAIGVAPRTTSGESAPEKALFTWLDTFDVDASVPAGIYIPE